MELDQDLNALLDGFRRKGFAIALAMLGNADQAADAVQEGLRIYLSRGVEERPARDPAAWFYKVLRNHCVDQLRMRRVRHHVSLESVDPPDGAQVRPDAAMERDEFHARLKAEVERLDWPSREVLYMRDYLGLTYAQMADVLGIAPGTVMSRLHRARMSLREKLKDLM